MDTPRHENPATDEEIELQAEDLRWERAESRKRGKGRGFGRGNSVFLYDLKQMLWERGENDVLWR